MNYREFGDKNKETLIFLHGGGLSWWNYREAALLLRDEYHVILPILDGHTGSDRPFTAIEDNASRLISFIDDNLGGSALFIGGLSLGAQILLEMLSRRNDICSFALVESAAALPSKLTAALIGPAIDCSYGLIRRKGFAKLQFRSLRIRKELFDDYYEATCGIAKSDMKAFLKANTSYALKDAFASARAEVHVYYGEKETREIRRSAREICRKRPACAIHPMPGYRHGDLSLNHPREYADTVRRIIR